MANLHFFDIFFFFFIFQFFGVQLSTSAYTLPDQFFINCGSSDITPVNRRNYVGDEKPNSFSLSSAHSTAVRSSSSSSLYGTARTFSRESWYELHISQSGTYVVRFHFYPFTPQGQGIDLSSARFNVSVPNFYLLSDFRVQNSTSTGDFPLIEEFLLNITAGKFRIYFTPSGPSSFAFVNAIETFLAPDDFILDSDVTPAGASKNESRGLLSNALQLIYRINVGGNKITPDLDTLLRTWIPDDEFMHPRDAAVNTPYRSSPPSYRSKASLPSLNPPPIPAIDSSFAPDIVYNFAKVLANNSVVSASWGFSVNRNSKFLVRAHFCDVISSSGTDPLKFNLSIYAFDQLVDPHTYINDVGIPFYFDFVVDSDGSGFMNVSIASRPDSDSDNKTAFLNGLEIMELISSSGSIPWVNESNGSSKKVLFIIVGAVIGGVAVIIASAVLLWYCLKVRKGEKMDTFDEWHQIDMKRRSSYSRSTERNVHGSPLPDLNLGLKMAFGEILYATKNFNDNLVIGEGGFGKVYRGTLRDGTKVAVKRSEPGRTQGLSEFQTEIMVLSKIHHRHLVSLIGYCDERSEMVLVYEFMEKGTLRDHLYGFKEESAPRLSWEKRLELCIDATRGLHYLHTCLDGTIIHRDVKSTNILLDEDFRAKVADFGISRLSALDQTHVSTDVKGSFGYFDPEYYRCLLLTQKSDVYSFGVVLLEVLCARPAIDASLPKDQINLADWGTSCMIKGELGNIVDPFLSGKIAPDSLRKFGEIVQRCLQESGDDRPTMGDLLWSLEYALQLQKTKMMLRNPQEDSGNSDVSYNMLLPVVSRLPSNSIAISEEDDEMGSDQLDSEMNESSTNNASAVFSQIMVQEAR